VRAGIRALTERLLGVTHLAYSACDVGHGVRTGATLQRFVVGGFQAADSYAPGQRVVVNAWLLRHPDALVIIDTGLAANLPEDDVRELRMTRRPIIDALADAGVRATDVELVLNCHLHADHAGGNVEFRGTPILVQPEELAAARQPDYSVADALDLDGGRYEVRGGEHEPLPGVRVVPTPGHSPGHQAVVVDTVAGRVLLAGQSFRGASEFAMALTALRLARDGFPEPPDYPAWLPRLVELEAWRVVFGHDTAVWQQDA
jgi:N-acyl homoserine lactone hydrolase